VAKGAECAEDGSGTGLSVLEGGRVFEGAGSGGGGAVVSTAWFTSVNIAYCKRTVILMVATRFLPYIR
jgi:hypothetical protein